MIIQANRRREDELQNSTCCKSIASLLVLTKICMSGELLDSYRHFSIIYIYVHKVCTRRVLANP